ncbi:MAG: metallophosphoesterase [Polyangiales bacterium]
MMHRDGLFGAIAAALVMSLAAGARADGPKKPRHKPTRIALIGDMPYRDTDIVKLDEVLREINESRVDFTLHTGDIKSGSTLCADELLQTRFDQLAQLERPLVYTPGDNEWTDCHREAAGGYDPLERLATLRKLFFPQPGRTLGKQPIEVQTQAADPAHAAVVENVRFVRDDVVFATVHVVGSNNGMALWNGIGESETAPRPERLAEVQSRVLASLAWIDGTFDEAEKRGAAGVLIAMQANPAFESEAGDPLRVGFEEIITKLTERTLAFGRPVLVAHGDSHYQRFDKPLLGPTASDGPQRIEDFSRAENFGDLDVHWVELVVDTHTPQVFNLVPHIVESNRFVR